MWGPKHFLIFTGHWVSSSMNYPLPPDPATGRNPSYSLTLCPFVVLCLTNSSSGFFFYVAYGFFNRVENPNFSWMVVTLFLSDSAATHLLPDHLPGPTQSRALGLKTFPLDSSFFLHSVNEFMRFPPGSNLGFVIRASFTAWKKHSWSETEHGHSRVQLGQGSCPLCDSVSEIWQENNRDTYLIN